MKTFKYRWKKGAHEFTSMWIEEWRDELEQDIKNRGGELIEILKETEINKESTVGQNIPSYSSKELKQESLVDFVNKLDENNSTEPLVQNNENLVEYKDSRSEAKIALALWGIFLSLCVVLISWDTIFYHSDRDKFSIQPTSSETLSTCWFFLIASILVFIASFIYALPTIIRFCKGLVKFIWWVFIIGLVLWGIWSFTSGIAAMGSTTFLLWIIIWQLSEMQNRRE